MQNYDQYNREERAICAHLFRLLHENFRLEDRSPLGIFIKNLFQNNLELSNGTLGYESLQFDNVGIYTEMALI